LEFLALSRPSHRGPGSLAGILVLSAEVQVGVPAAPMQFTMGRQTGSGQHGLKTLVDALHPGGKQLESVNRVRGGGGLFFFVILFAVRLKESMTQLLAHLIDDMFASL